MYNIVERGEDFNKRKEPNMAKEKVLINGSRHFLETVEKYLKAFISILITLPAESRYVNVNIKNLALFDALNISFDGPRGFKAFLLEKELITLHKEGKYNPSTEKKVCDKYSINFYNLCNFLLAIKNYKGEFSLFESARALAKRNYLPQEIDSFLMLYGNKSALLQDELEKGVHYEIEKCIDDNKDIFVDFNGEVIRQTQQPRNRYNW